MKNKIKYLLTLAIVSLFMPSMPFGIQTDVLSAQTACGASVAGCAVTTLSAAMAAGAAVNQMALTSVTGITASGTSVSNLTFTGGQQLCMIDKELVLVRAVNTTSKIVTVVRANKGLSIGHVNGARVICGGGGNWNPNTGNVFGIFINGDNAQPSGLCVRTAQQFLPVFAINLNIGTGFTYDCLGGHWVQGTLPDAPDPQELVLACNVPIGSVAFASLGTNTVDIAGREFVTSIYVPQTGFVTGLQILAGASAVTDSWTSTFRDMNGNLLFNGALTGIVPSGANTFQTAAFTAKAFVLGPALYFAGFQGNSASSSYRAVAASTFKQVIGASQAGTFGTVPLTFVGGIPTTFTADFAPFVCIAY